MLKIENTEVVGWEAAIREMRYSKISWGNSDSGMCPNGTEFGHCYLDHRKYCPRRNTDDPAFCISPKDLDLMMLLRNTDTDNRKFMQMITVYLDITAPLYWWKEFDTHKIDIVTNSCSLMHRIADKEFTLDDFSHEHLIAREKPLAESVDASVDAMEPPNAIWLIHRTIQTLNQYRNLYLQTMDKKYWWQLIQLLPSSYNQKRTVMMNYKVLANIYKSLRNHKLDEWHTFCDWIETLLYSELITGNDAVNELQ